MVIFSKQKMLGVVALVAWGGAFGHSASVQAGPPSLADCATISTDQARLACYDQAAARLAPTTPEPGPVSTAMTVPLVLPDPDEPGEVKARPAVEGTLIERAWGFEPDSGRYMISLYRPNYLLLGRYSDRPNEAPFDVLFNALDNPDAKLDSTEAQFQISFKARLWTTDDRRFGLWAAYTQQNQWQVYNDDLSRPFRETNYQPELILSFKPGISFWGFHWGLLNLGYNHQSNGRADPISRSWDRIIAEIGIERGDFALLIRPWIVISDGGDDNPDIEDYYGHGDITAFYRWHGHSFTLMGRGNVDTGKGTARFSWMSPPLIGPMRAYVVGSSGYGDSMIDHNWRQNTIGIGVALNDVL